MKGISKKKFDKLMYIADQRLFKAGEDIREGDVCQIVEGGKVVKLGKLGTKKQMCMQI